MTALDAPFALTTGDQQAAYQQSIATTLATLDRIDVQRLAELSRLTLPEITALKAEIARMFPAGNLPGFILDGLMRLPGRTVSTSHAERDVRALFQGLNLIPQSLFGAFIAGPAAVLMGYQKLLALAGKDVDSAFPEGAWQFYLEFGVREDAARHANETIGFQRELPPGAPDVLQAAAWAMAIARLVVDYDDLLAQAWYELTTLRLLGEVDARAGAHARQAWSERCPYAGIPGVPYVTHRQRVFNALLGPYLEELAPAARRQWRVRMAECIDGQAEYPAQLSLLYALTPERFREVRRPIPLWRARLAIVAGGAYYLLPLVATDAQGRPLLFAASGASEPLRADEDGRLYDAAGRRVSVDRAGNAWPVQTAGVRAAREPGARPEALGRLQPAPPHAWRQQCAAVLSGSAPAATQVDLWLARAPRAQQEALRGRLDPATLAALDALREAPVILHWDSVTRDRPLPAVRSVRRGAGDHALTVIRTPGSTVFDLSHIFFDGVWALAVAEILTNEATACYRELAAYERLQVPGSGVAPERIALNGTLAFESAVQAALQFVPCEVAVENDTLDLARVQLARRVLAQRGVSLTVNDLLLLYRALHAAWYTVSLPVRAAAAEVRAALAEFGEARALAAQLDALLDPRAPGNPALLIPMDASGVNPRERLFPTTFRNPLGDLAGRHRDVYARMHALRGRAATRDERAEAETLRREYLAHLQAFGLLLAALKDVTMRGAGFNTATIRLLAHLPPALQHALDQIPQQIGILNEIVKGEEVFSNVGRVARGSSLVRFSSARDDVATKTLVWGVLTDDAGRVHISLRDFRPHVAGLLRLGPAGAGPALARRLAQDFLDQYVTGLNQFVNEAASIALGE